MMVPERESSLGCRWSGRSPCGLVVEFSNLDEGGLELSETILEGLAHLAEAILNGAEYSREGIDGEARIGEPRRCRAQVDSGKLEEAVGVVRHNGCWICTEQLLLELHHVFFLLGHREVDRPFISGEQELVG